MASDILKNEILQTQVGDTKKVSKKSVNNEVKKEGGSLFDSLLQVAKAKVDEQDSLKKSHTQSGQTTLTKEIAPKINENGVNKTLTETKLVNRNLEQTLKSNQKIVQETINKPIEAKINNDIQKIGKTTPLTSVPASDETILDKSQKKFENQITKVNHNQKQEERKGSLSLLDKMMQDIKKEIPNNQKIASEVSPQAKKDQSITTKVSSVDNLEDKKIKEKQEVKRVVDKEVKPSLDLVKGNITEEVKREVVKPTTEIKTVKINNQLVEKENQTTKGEMVPKKVSTPTSLLDKMVQSIVDNTIEAQEIVNDEKNDLKKSEYKVVTKSDESVGKLFAELQNGIKLENKTQLTKTDIAPNLNPNETKESTILSSLADSLSGKTKLQKKVDEVAKLESLQDPKAQFGANVFLANQKVQGEILSKQKLTEAQEVLKDGQNSTKTIKRSADILELKPKGLELSVEEEIAVVTTKQPFNKSNEIGIHNQQSFLNRVFLNKETISQINDAKIAQEQIVQTKLSQEDTKKVNQDVTITVERTLVETFTTKVIASKQAMGSFMSDVARNMYLNYRPPVTAFKINLDPLNLGSIAIVMKNNKSENTLSISLNMSQNTTYETFNDNKSAMQNALGRVFNQNEGSFSLDFGMQNDSSNQEFEQQRQNQENRQLIENRIDRETTVQDDGQVIELETTKSYM